MYAIARGWWKSDQCLIPFCTPSPEADGNQVCVWSPSVRQKEIRSVSDPLLYAVARGWWKSGPCLIPFCTQSPEADGNQVRVWSSSVRHRPRRLCLIPFWVRHRRRLMEIRSMSDPLLYVITPSWWKLCPCLIHFCTPSPEADGNQVLACWSPSVRHRPRLMEIMSVSDPLLYAIARGWWKSGLCLILFCTPSP
jgi:hypothetical protein